MLRFFLKVLAIFFSLFLCQFWQGVFTLSFWHNGKREILVVRNAPGFSVSTMYCLQEPGANCLPPQPHSLICKGY